MGASPTEEQIRKGPLIDLVPDDNTLSIWYIEDDRSNLEQVAVAFASTRDSFSNFDYALVDEALINVARFIGQIEHHLIFYCFAELVGVDVAAKDFEAGLLVLLEQRRAGETDEDGVGHDRLHDAVQFAALGAMAFIHEDKNLAHRLARLGLQFFDELLKIVHVLLCQICAPVNRADAAAPAPIGSSGRARFWSA